MLFSFFCAHRRLLFVWLESWAGCKLMGGNAICLLRRVGPLSREIKIGQPERDALFDYV